MPAAQLPGIQYHAFGLDVRALDDDDVAFDRRNTRRNLAGQVIERLGFTRQRLGRVGSDWWRAGDKTWLDLHYTLSGLRVPPMQVWMTLWAEREIMALHGATVPILNERAPVSRGVTHLIEGDWRQRWVVLKRWLWPYDELLTDLDHGRIPIVPTWVQRRRSRYGKFYLWRCYQAFSFLRMWPRDATVAQGLQ
jgi:hypothetical protein